MMIAFKCDVCGGFYEWYKDVDTEERFTGANSLRFYCVYDSDEPDYTERIDLCPDCIHEVKKTLKRLRGDENET